MSIKSSHLSNQQSRPTEDQSLSTKSVIFDEKLGPEEIHIKTLKCEECSKVFATFTTLHRHVIECHRQIKRFECDFCSEVSILSITPLTI